MDNVSLTIETTSKEMPITAKGFRLNDNAVWGDWSHPCRIRPIDLYTTPPGLGICT